MDLFGAAGDEVPLVCRGGFVVSNKAGSPRLTLRILTLKQPFESL
jgi:hypothetical protein